MKTLQNMQKFKEFIKTKRAFKKQNITTMTRSERKKNPLKKDFSDLAQQPSG